MSASNPYNDYNSYLKNKYGTKVYRIGLDAGFSCPNRDGTKGTGGCLYCDKNGSRSPYADPKATLSSQLESRIRYLKQKRGAQKFIAYFQAFTNTHGSLNRLKSAYDEILPFKEIVGISIGTRPDAIDREKLSLIASYQEKYEVWLEYGLQSSHDKTLKFINRAHSYQEFADAVELAHTFHIPVCAHVILGLPGEGREEVVETARRITALRIEGIKIHSLHVLRDSPLEKLYNDNKIELSTLDEYSELVCDFLENLPSSVIVKRLTGQGGGESHVAPSWALDKTMTMKRIGEVFEARGSYQGSKLSSHP